MGIALTATSVEIGGGFRSVSAGVELEADFAHGRPTHGYAPGARAVVRAVGGGAPLGAAEARAALAAHGDAMQHVLDRMAGRAVGRSYEQLKVADLPDGYYVGALALALLLPAALSLLSYLAPDAAAAQRGRKSKAH